MGHVSGGTQARLRTLLHGADRTAPSLPALGNTCHPTFGIYTSSIFTAVELYSFRSDPAVSCHFAGAHSRHSMILV